MNLKNVMYGAISFFFIIASFCAISIANTYSKNREVVEIDYGHFVYKAPVGSAYEAASLFHKMGYDYQRAEERVDKAELLRYEAEH